MAPEPQTILEWKISLGTLLHLVATLGLLVGIYVKIKIEITELKTMVAPMWNWWNSNGEDSVESKHFESKVEHAVRNAAIKVIPEIIEQDRRQRERHHEI